MNTDMVTQLIPGHGLKLKAGNYKIISQLK